MAESTCPRCGNRLFADHSVAIKGHKVVHLDCDRPRELTSEERALLYLYCSTHVVAKCVACDQVFRQRELAVNQVTDNVYRCPRCHIDLTESLRDHLYSCTMMPAEVRRRAQEARDAAIRLVKQSHQLTDRADMLIAAAEAAIAALREAIGRKTGPTVS